MAETIAVQRGTHYTHNMHIYPGEMPTGVWASIEAQSAGYVAGIWQNHLACSPWGEIWEVTHQDDYHYPLQLQQWRVNWPPLGSYARLSFTVQKFGAWHWFEFIVRLWNDSYSATFYDGTVTKEMYSGDSDRITFEWDVGKCALADHMETNMYVEVLGMLTVPDPGYPESWRCDVSEFLMITANRPF